MSNSNALFLSIGLISLDPQFTSTLGGSPIVVSGPRLNISEDDQIVCTFNTVQVPGIYVDSERVLCVSPPLTQTGRMPFEIEVMGANGFFGQTNFENSKYSNMSALILMKFLSYGLNVNHLFFFCSIFHGCLRSVHRQH